MCVSVCEYVCVCVCVCDTRYIQDLISTDDVMAIDDVFEDFVECMS